MFDRSRFLAPVLVLLLGACGQPEVRGGGSPTPGPAPGTGGTIAPPPTPDAAPISPVPTLPTGPMTCGNGKLEGTESCDDGNTKAGDGCTADCAMVEPGFACPTAGSACMERMRCGDRAVSMREQCDDGNAAGGDGCAADCKLEAGWVCPAGGVCRAARCGDGVKVGAERCDDGNATAGDGCSATCLVEAPAETEADGWICPTAGQPCQRTTCGNQMAEGSEQCDDGNNDSGDGCSPYCRREPTCPAAGGACNSACGDGLLLPTDMAAGQECDDGNTVGDDGCTSDCKLEKGFACAAMPIAPDPLRLPIIYRDFKAFEEQGGHPDFQRFVGTGEANIVQPMLDMQGKPAHVMAARGQTVNNDPGFVGTDYFSFWWRDHPMYNRTIREQLTFTRAGMGWSFASNAFFPLEGRGFGTYMGMPYRGGGYRNFHFTSEVRHWFEYRGGERLDFTGDDDVFVFINKRLVVDLGGVHMARSGAVTLDAANGNAAVCDLLSVCPATRTVMLGLERGRVYEMVVFQAERRTDESNYRLTLANFSGSRTACKSVCGDGVVTADEACDLGMAGNTGAYGTCNPDCTLTPRCGDGVVNGPEECDGDDTCSATCRRRTVD